MKKLLFIGLFLLLSEGVMHAQIVINGQNTPETIPQNSEVSVSITYTSSVEISEWQIQLFPTNLDGSINYGGTSTQVYIGNNYTGSNPPIAGNTLPIAVSPSTLTFTSYLDGNVVPVGTYKWFVKLKENSATPEQDAVYGDNSISVTVTNPSLSIGNSNDVSSVFIVNSLSKTLFVTNKVEKGTSITIFNMAGQKVKTITDVSGDSTYDLSALGNNMYVLVTSTNHKIKFSL